MALLVAVVALGAVVGLRHVAASTISAARQTACRLLNEAGATHCGGTGLRPDVDAPALPARQGRSGIERIAGTQALSTEVVQDSSGYKVRLGGRWYSTGMDERGNLFAARTFNAATGVFEAPDLPPGFDPNRPIGHATDARPDHLVFAQTGTTVDVGSGTWWKGAPDFTPSPESLAASDRWRKKGTTANDCGSAWGDRKWERRCVNRNFRVWVKRYRHLDIDPSQPVPPFDAFHLFQTLYYQVIPDHLRDRFAPPKYNEGTDEITVAHPGYDGDLYPFKANLLLAQWSKDDNGDYVFDPSAPFLRLRVEKQTGFATGLGRTFDLSGDPESIESAVSEFESAMAAGDGAIDEAWFKERYTIERDGAESTLIVTPNN